MPKHRPSITYIFTSSFLPFPSLLYHLPIQNLPELCKMGSTTVLVVEVISMLPNVESQQRFQPLGHRVKSTRFLCNDQRAINLSGQPYPATAKETYTLGNKLFFKSIDTPPLLLNLSSQCTRRHVRYLCRPIN